MHKYVALILFFFIWACSAQTLPEKSAYNTYLVPIAGNGWFDQYNESDIRNFTEKGLEGWEDADKEVWIYFYAEEVGEISLALNSRVHQGNSKLTVRMNDMEKTLQINDTDFKKIFVGTFKIVKPGYQKVIIRGLEKSGNVFADISDLEVVIPENQGIIHFVKDDFYWGRRGPSVHFFYQMPEKDIQWVFNEITVPVGSDVLGSYYMANGFGEGYFGIQANSPTERRVLFSVWSPFETDDPNSIPEDKKIVLLKKGKDVYTGEFGNEGSGGQSYLRYNWVAGNTYKFLTRIEPSSVEGSTEYTSYFYAPEIKQWQLIASFRRPETVTYAKHFYSFLENFQTGSGHLTRNVFFTNQWVRDTDGNWTELTSAKFTADVTARKGNRLDYAGKVSGSQFELINCGFFSPNVPFDTFMDREPTGIVPQINWQEIEEL